MKIPINFRGGKYVFGKFCRVRYCDIAKFAAYDKYGRRVYKGDIFGIPSGNEIADVLIKNLRGVQSNEKTD